MDNSLFPVFDAASVAIGCNCGAADSLFKFCVCDDPQFDEDIDMALGSASAVS